MTRYDHLPEKDARRAATQTLALAKWVQDQARQLAKPLEEEAKQWLAENALDPGSRVPALIDGDEVATISRSKRTIRRTYEIEDEQAYGDWIIENGHKNPFEIRLADWARSQNHIAALAEAQGELPDGVKMRTTETGGSVAVRQTDTQRDNLEQHISALRQITDTFDTLLVEGDES